MKKYKILPIIFAAVIAVTPLVGCSKGKDDADSKPTIINKQEGLAKTEIKAEILEETLSNETTFKLNNVIDSGKTDDNGNRYLYLDVAITNNTDKVYDLNILNNFYLLLPDEEEIHFDVRTQLYGQKEIETYIPSPFTLSANGNITGIVGGFIVPPDKNNFTVCFFPTQEILTNKESVIKVDVTAENIVKLEK